MKDKYPRKNEIFVYKSRSCYLYLYSIGSHIAKYNFKTKKWKDISKCLPCRIENETTNLNRTKRRNKKKFSTKTLGLSHIGTVIKCMNNYTKMTQIVSI